MTTRFLVLLAALAATPALACPTHDVALDAPTKAKADAQRQVDLLLDTPFVKLVRIRLRGGAVLADHKAPVAITVQALEGTGTVITGEQKDPLRKGNVVLIAPGAEHRVVPAGKEDLVVLVHFLKSVGGAKDAGDHACDHPDHPKGEAHHHD